jgi:hypothetical protein
MAAKTRQDIANTAVRIFLQEFGATYDEERTLPRYVRKKHLPEIAEFFGDRCCYCGSEFGPTRKPVEDHLIPLNRTELGLHAWGNIVPSCDECNRFKHAKEWHAVVAAKAGRMAADRYKRIKEYIEQHGYAPPYDLANATADLYAEVGDVAMALIRTKVKRTHETDS